MKKVFLLTSFLLLCLPKFVYSQVYDLNAYKYIVVNDQDDPKDIKSTVSQEFKSYGFESLINGREMPADFNSCEALYCQIIYKPYETFSQKVELKLTDCYGNLIAESKASCAVCGFTVVSELQKASIKAVQKLEKLKEYKYDSTILEKKPSNVEVTNNNVDFNFSDEKSIRSYLLDNDLDDIEGIWRTGGTGDNYKLLILKDDYYYNAYIIEDTPYWKTGELKAIFEPIAVDDMFTLKWTMADRNFVQETVVALENKGLLKFTLRNTDNNQPIESIIYKVFPPLSSSNKRNNQKVSKGEWAGNGSGIIISKSGYIVTNYHVIDDADEIEVEFILNGELQKLNAEIVQVDKVNDLAILRIFDMNFDGLDDLPYNFQSRSSDVGTTVYAYGYPMALTAMGKEIKVTDGIINSKSGFQGDITTYQISAPIQKGNSGGPLFDDQGNFIGINSAVIRKDVADNVGYTIKSSYVLNLIDVLPSSIELPSSSELKSLPLTEQIKQISKFVVLIKVK